MTINTGDFHHNIEIWEMQNIFDDNNNPILDELGEQVHDYVKIKDVFARIETRVGGLLSGRPADTVMTTVTHKMTWNYNNFNDIRPNKHIIKYRNKIFDVNYSLNTDFKDELIEVFVTEKTVR